MKARFFSLYHRFFSIQEIEGSITLQWFFGATLFGFFITFNRWATTSVLTIETAAQGAHRCWPFFQSCGNWFFLSTLPYGYTQTTLYMFFFVLMGLIVLLMWQKDWVHAHALMMILFLWELTAMFLTMEVSANYWYYHLLYTFVLLFLPFKIFFLRITFVVMYMLAGSVKLHPGWLKGTYFSSLKTGLPLFPDFAIPFITNLVVFMEIIGSWFLLSSRKWLRYGVLGYFTIFHFYSGILVYYMYPAIVLPPLLILFIPPYAHDMKFPRRMKSIVGWVLIALLIAIQSISWFIHGDVKMTLEGNKYGLFMFEANHQCISEYIVYQKDGTAETRKRESINARDRCSPYYTWFSLHQFCLQKKNDIARIQWTFDHSINGGPYFRIVDTQNVCALEYHAWKHNEWIRLPEEGAKIMGYPEKNYYF